MKLLSHTPYADMLLCILLELIDKDVKTFSYEHFHDRPFPLCPTCLPSGNKLFSIPEPKFPHLYKPIS